MLISDITNLFTYQTEYVRNLSSLWSSAARLEELTALELINPALEAPSGSGSVAAAAGR